MSFASSGSESGPYDADPTGAVFNPYSPEVTAEDSPEFAAPPADDPEVEALADTAAATEPPAPVTPPAQFDPRWKEEFSGLLYLGRLESTVTILGHKFVLRTLDTEKMLEVALITKPYVNTKAEGPAYQTAVVAASVQSVDGQPLAPNVLGADMDLTPKFNYVAQKWMPALRELIFAKTWELETAARQALDALGEASG